MFVARVVVFTDSVGLPTTFTKRTTPLFNPALSTSVPVFCFVPIYTGTELFMMPVPPSLGPTTIVLSCTYGHANAFSHAPTPVKPDPFVVKLNLPKIYALPLSAPVTTVPIWYPVALPSSPCMKILSKDPLPVFAL